MQRVASMLYSNSDTPLEGEVLCEKRQIHIEGCLLDIPEDRLVIL